MDEQYLVKDGVVKGHSDSKAAFKRTFGIKPPEGCDRCHTPLNECKGVSDPAMDGVHQFEGDKWWCDKCLQELGRREAGLE
jgi:hypothetical protein